MATKPKIVTLTNSSVEVLNAIRNAASTNYQNYVPVATDDAEVIKKIGAVLMDFPALQNEFLSALVNRIGKVLITSKSYTNPWAMFKRGLLDFGESVEEIFVELAKPFEFDPSGAENTVFKREIPDVRSAFHVLNYQKYYKTTVSREELRQAFVSVDGVNNLISKIVDSLYTGMNYDEFLTMKYLLAQNIINGMLRTKTVDTSNPKATVQAVKSTSNKLTFLNADNNFAGVHTHTLKDDQYVLINADFQATMDVEVLANAFNMSKAEFMGHQILVDGFGELDVARLNVLFADDPTYTAPDATTLAALNAIPLVVVDRDYFMIFDKTLMMTDIYNGEGLYWNYWLHSWKVFSTSPFAQAVVFVPTSSGVTSVTITPSAVTEPSGWVGTLNLGVAVVTTGFADKRVKWSIVSSSDDIEASINAAGVLKVTDNDETSAATITVTATSVYDPTVTGTATITFSAAE